MRSFLPCHAIMLLKIAITPLLQLSPQLVRYTMIPAPFSPQHEENHSVLRRVYDFSLNELRHSTVYEALKHSHAKRVLDLGCNTGDFLRLLCRSAQLQLVAGMDCEDQALNKAVNNATPELVQSSIQFDRDNDLAVRVYKGDLTKEYTELKAQRFQVVTMIEVIQHLPPPVIPAATHTLFGYLRAPLIVITTPNKEFNAHFRSNPEQLRHWDHKFEWTRAQFQLYCKSVSEQYGYSYELRGIGEHVSDSSLGQCSQMAIFSLTKPQSLQQAQKHEQGELKQENQLQLKVEHTIPCWSTNLSEIMLQLFYSGLCNSVQKTYAELLEYINTVSLLGRSFQKKQLELNADFLAAYVSNFSSQFEWDQAKYWRREAKSEPLQSQQLQYQRQLEDYLANSSFLYFSQYNQGGLQQHHENDLQYQHKTELQQQQKTELQKQQKTDLQYQHKTDLQYQHKTDLQQQQKTV